VTQKFLVYLAPEQIANQIQVCTLVLFESLLATGKEAVERCQPHPQTEWVAALELMQALTEARLCMRAGTSNSGRPLVDLKPR
jgi:hypothetical protein